jgi:ribose 5-phosphate isomerase B
VLSSKLYEIMANKYMNVKHLGCCSTTPTDYPLFAKRVADELEHFSMFRGILICGTGQGMVMAANKYSWIRAGLCERSGQARQIRQHSDANVLCLSGNLLTAEDAWPIVEAFLYTDASIEKRHVERRKMYSHA